MICVILACALVAPQTKPARSYIALPGTPLLYSEKGKPINRLRVAFHRLDFVRRGADGVSHFRLDGVKPVKVRSNNLYDEDSLIPLVESPKLKELRHRYEGHKVWLYGGGSFFAESINPRVSVLASVPIRDSVVVARIYQLAKQDISFSSNDIIKESGLELRGSYRADELAGAGPLLFIFKSPNRRDLSWGFPFEEAGSHRHWTASSFGETYYIYPEDWYFEQLFSLKSPSRAEVRAGNRIPPSLDMGDISKKLAGMTRREVAIWFGFPLENKPLPEIMKEPEWREHLWIFRFKSDRLVYAFEEMSH